MTVCRVMLNVLLTSVKVMTKSKISKELVL